MQIQRQEFFNQDLNRFMKNFQETTKSRLEGAQISHDTSDEVLADIKKKVLTSIWNLNEVTIKEEPIEKSSSEVNFNHREAMDVLRQANSSGNNPATIASYMYAYTGSQTLLTHSQGGHSKYAIWGGLSSDRLVINIPFAGLITENNVEAIKTNRDNILIHLKQVVEYNNQLIKNMYQDLSSVIDTLAEQIRAHKIRIKKTNDLL